METITYITSNPGKARLLSRYEEAQATSMRRIALKKLEAYLKGR